MSNQPEEEKPELSNRGAALEKQVRQMADLLADHMASLRPFLLVGWIEISTYCRKKPQTLSRYAKGLAFPAFRCQDMSFVRHTRLIVG
jgi:hypothetical protein